MSKLSSPTLPPAPFSCFISPSCATRALLLLGCYTLRFWCLHGISSCVPNVVPISHICLETPRAAAEQFPQQSRKLSFFKSTPKAKKSLPANNFWPRCWRQRSRGCRPNPFSWKVLCCCLFWKHRCNWFLCSVFWCHQFPGMRSWPCAYKWKISIIFSEMGSSSKFPLWTELLSNVLLCVQDGIWLRWK